MIDIVSSGAIAHVAVGYLCSAVPLAPLVFLALVIGGCAIVASLGI